MPGAVVACARRWNRSGWPRPAGPGPGSACRSAATRCYGLSAGCRTGRRRWSGSSGSTYPELGIIPRWPVRGSEVWVVSGFWRSRGGATAWRMSADDYTVAVAALDADHAIALTGRSVATPWDPAL